MHIMKQPFEDFKDEVQKLTVFTHELCEVPLYYLIFLHFGKHPYFKNNQSRYKGGLYSNTIFKTKVKTS